MANEKKNIHQIESSIWEMANRLRGSMDASEYKNYILSFMFYRYLSNRQVDYIKKENLVTFQPDLSVSQSIMEELFGTHDLDKMKEAAEISRNFTRFYVEKRDKNGQVVKNPDGSTVMEPVADWVEDYMEYLKDVSSSLGYCIPPLYSWSSISKMLQDREMVPSDYQAMFDAFNASLSYNKDAEIDFRGVFSDVHLGDTRLGSTTEDRTKALGRIVDLVSEISFKDENGKDILGAIYEYLIKQFAATAGKKSGEFYTPHEISLLMSKIVTYGWDKPDYTFTVFDPTCGSGSLLLTVGKELPGGNRPGAVTYYGQEMNTTTYNLARMNLMMNGVDYKHMHLRNADTLGPDWPLGIGPDGKDNYLAFDAVVANPPYSAKWDAPESYMKDKRFREYGRLAPKTKADYAFVLDGFYHLNPTGTMAVVLPHGVLFRGAAELEIRKKLLMDGSIYAIISLAPNLFYGTSIPTIILVLKRTPNAAKDVLFIDASKDFKKGKPKNYLDEEIIDKIVDAYIKRKDIEKFAHLASFKEIEENDFNLNVPRYVDTSEEEEEIDLAKVQKELEEVDKEIAEVTKKIEEMAKQLVWTNGK